MVNIKTLITSIFRQLKFKNQIMRKQLFIILNVAVILFSFSCNKKQELSSMENYLDKKYSICISQNEQIANRLYELIGENKNVLIPLIDSDPILEKSEFCYEFYAEIRKDKVEISTLLVFDFTQDVIALAYSSSELDSIIYLFENEEKIPMPIHFVMEEEFLNKME